MFELKYVLIFKYIKILLIAVFVFASSSAYALNITFSPSSFQLDVGEKILVTANVTDIPAPGLAAFQLQMNFDPSIVSISQPNPASINPFEPLGGHPFCGAISPPRCSDADPFLLSTGRSPYLAEALISGGTVRIAYATSGVQDLPKGTGAIAIFEVTGVTDGQFNLTITPDMILADNAEPPASYSIDNIATAGINITVGSTPADNQAPNVTNPGNQTVNEGDSITLQINANDPDGDALSYAATGLPSALSIDSTSGLISGSFATGTAGNHAISITVTDDGTPNEATTVTFDIQVNTTQTQNQAPNITSPGTQYNAAEDKPSLAINSTDPDGDKLNYSASGLPDGLSINPTTGIISGTITESALANNIVQVTVTDDGTPEKSSSTNFNWKIGEDLIVPTSPANIPTISEWSLFLLSLLLMGFGLFFSKIESKKYK